MVAAGAGAQTQAQALVEQELQMEALEALEPHQLSQEHL
jgi:hypothetical protein